MSLYRRFIVAVAVMGLATSVFAADESTKSTTTTTTNATTVEAAQDAPTPVASTTTTTTTTATTDKLNLNTATSKELATIKGLTQVKAKSIVSFRKKHGEFKSVQDLKSVKGFKRMNEKTLQAIEDQLTVG
jgi:competence protein ComEA